MIKIYSRKENSIKWFLEEDNCVGTYSAVKKAQKLIKVNPQKRFCITEDYSVYMNDAQIRASFDQSPYNT